MWLFRREREPLLVTVRQSFHKCTGAQQSRRRGECELREPKCEQPRDAGNREMKQQRQSDGSADRDAEDHEKPPEQSHTVGAHLGA